MREERLGPYVLTLPPGVFPLGGDTLALGRFATVRPRWRVCDLGTGSGALLLLLRGREPSLELWGVERDGPSASAARENLRQNGLEGEILQADLQSAPLPAGRFDLVVSNPPYFPRNSGKSGGPFREETCPLPQLCAAAARLVRNGGRFALCHRPERLCDVMCALRESGLEPKRLRLVCARQDRAPSLLLLGARRGGRPGLRIGPPLLLENPDGSPTAELDRIYFRT